MSHRGQRHGHRALEARRIGAVTRADLRAARSNAEQIAELDRRLGVGVGAARERARLSAQIGKVAKPAFTEELATDIVLVYESSTRRS